MRGLEWLKELMSQLKEDEHLRSRLGPGATMLDKAVEELEQLSTETTTRDYQVFGLADKDYGAFRVINGEIQWPYPIGTRVSYSKTNLIYNPIDMRYDAETDTVFVTSWNWGVRLFDRNFSYKGGFSKNLGYCWGIDVNGEIVVVSDNYGHRVRCLDRKGTLLWTLGDGVAGALVDGHLYRPTGVAILPNGNIMVACNYGRETSSDPTYGTISEHDRNTGELVKVHLKYQGNGQAWNNEVYRPTFMRVVYPPNSDPELWFSMERDYVAVFTIDPNTGDLTYKRVYGRSDRFSLFSMTVRGLAVSTDYRRLYVAVAGPQVVGVLDIDSGDVLGFVGHQGFENAKDLPETPGVFLDVQGVELIEDQELLVADSSNHRIQGFPTGVLEVPGFVLSYSLLDGADQLDDVLYTSDDKFDLSTLTRIVATRDLITCSFPKKVLLCGRRHIC